MFQFEHRLAWSVLKNLDDHYVVKLDYTPGSGWGWEIDVYDDQGPLYKCSCMGFTDTPEEALKDLIKTLTSLGALKETPTVDYNWKKIAPRFAWTLKMVADPSARNFCCFVTVSGALTAQQRVELEKFGLRNIVHEINTATLSANDIKALSNLDCISWLEDSVKLHHC